MKILLSHRFFWPDTAPYGLMLRAISKELYGAGHDVDVLTTIPSYRTSSVTDDDLIEGQLDGIGIKRIWVFANEKKSTPRRIINILLYCWALVLCILRRRPDVVSVSTFPPIVAAWVAGLAAKAVGAQFVYHLQDIHPEISLQTGGQLGRGIARRLLCYLDNQTLSRATTIVVLSQDMAETINARGLGELPIRIIKNFSVEAVSETSCPPVHLRKKVGTRRAIFAGNLGRFQNLEKLAEGVSQVFPDYPDLELFFLGDGAAAQGLKEMWGGHPRIKFGSFLPPDQANKLIEESDIGLVSLEKGLYRLAYPSKIATYLHSGVPVLAFVEAQSSIAHDLSSNNLGVAVNVDKSQDMARAIRAILDVEEGGFSHLKAWADQNTSAEIILPKWVALFDEICSQ